VCNFVCKHTYILIPTIDKKDLHPTGIPSLTLLRYHNNVDLPVIPIHDEIIVPETKATMEFAEVALKDAFRETFGDEGSFGSIYAKWSFGEGKEDKTVEIKLGE
jgi:hypothetical protein